MRLRENIFMIACPARSGSTFLVTLLRSHPHILCHGEVLVGNGITGISGAYGVKSRENPKILEQLADERRENFERFLYKYVLDGQSKQVVGFKLKSDELVLPEYKKVKNVVVSDRDIAILHLNRRNLLARYLSWHVVNHVTGVTLVHEKHNVPNVPSVRLDPNACLHDFEVTRERETFTRNLFKDHRLIEVVYEDLASANQHVFHDICDFLGVSRQFLTSVTQKIIRQPLHGSSPIFS